MKLQELQQLDEGLIGDIIEKIAVGALVVSLIGTLGIVGWSVKDLYQDYDNKQQIVKQIEVKSPEDAKAYLSHLKAYSEALPRKSSTMIVGKTMIPIAGRAGDKVKAEKELKAIEEILKKHEVKK